MICGATRALEQRRDRDDDGWPHFLFECNSARCRCNVMVLLSAREAVERKARAFVQQLWQHNLRVWRRKAGVESCGSFALCVWHEFRTTLRLGREDTKVDSVSGVSGGGVSNQRIGGKQRFKM
jgi:hypothetical protein